MNMNVIKTLQADWLQREDLRHLIDSLGADNARYVGGVVRDTLLGIEAKDIDIATLLQPEVTMAKLQENGIKAIPTGIAHGTITAVLPAGPVEITTLRHDLDPDGRHASVAFTEDWQEDAARRDFTINALYAHPITGEISDWFGGLEDLAQSKVRFIGDAKQRIREDHLRILRYFRFQTRFGSVPADEESELACSELAATLKGLSRERIGGEMMNLLALPNPAPTIQRMAELNVLGVILSDAQPEALAQLIAYEKRSSIAPDAVRRLAALLPADENIAEQTAVRFRLSNAQRKRLKVAARRWQEKSNARERAYRLGYDSALDQLLLSNEDISALIGWEIPTFPLKGGTIATRGLAKGPEIARLLQAVETLWIAANFPSEERIEELLQIAMQD